MSACDFGGASFTPLISGGLWWPAQSALLVADLHLEKASFFASHGQMLPPYDSRATFDRLSEDMAQLRPARVYCLGDSFHDPGSFARLHEESRLALRRLTRAVEWHWIVGNHDPAIADDLGGSSSEVQQVEAFILRHEAKVGEGGFELSGHYHPKLRLQQRGRLLARRCFVRGARKLILPSYGAFTGGLDVTDPAFAALDDGPQDALVVGKQGLMRFAIGQLR
jgi:uncharacterized protein